MSKLKQDIFLSIIIPAYNEEKSINEVVHRLQNVLETIDKSSEIIIVDDGSTDDTVKNVQKELENSQFINLIQHKTNLGKGAAVKTGINNAKGKYILVQDADLEYDPMDIPTLLAPILNNESTVVYGNRFKKTKRPKSMSLSHYLGNKFLSFLTSVLYFKKINDMETGYKCLPKELYDRLNIQSTGFELEPELTAKILKKKIDIKEVPIHYEYRKIGEAKITWIDGIKAVWVLIKYRFKSMK